LKKAKKTASDELRPEYKRSDFGEMVRGKYVERLREKSNVVVEGPKQANVEVAFAEIRDEFNQTFGYVRQDIQAIIAQNPSLHYTLGLLICCACEMLAEHKSLKEHEVFTSLLPATNSYPVIGKSMWDALRNGLAHGFRPKTLRIGSHQWRFSICHEGPLVRVTEGEPNWLRLNVKTLNELVSAKINAYEEELRQSPSARLEFRNRHASTDVRPIPSGTREAEAWRSLLE
jgi:hypothetical protein